MTRGDRAPVRDPGTDRIPSGSPYRTPSWSPSSQRPRRIAPFLHPHASRVGEPGHRTNAVNIPRFEALSVRVSGPVTGPEQAHDPHRKKQRGCACCFRQTRDAMDSRLVCRPATVRSGPTVPLSGPTARLPSLSPSLPGHGRHQGGKGFRPSFVLAARQDGARACRHAAHICPGSGTPG